MQGSDGFLLSFTDCVTLRLNKLPQKEKTNGHDAEAAFGKNLSV